MGIVPAEFIQELSSILAAGGLAWIPTHLPEGNCTEPIQVRTTLGEYPQFSKWLNSLSERFNLPVPHHQGFLFGKDLKHKCSVNESAFLYDVLGLTQLKGLIKAAFENGEPQGFMALEL